MKKERANEILIGAGREVASGWLHGAVEAAETPAQADNQMQMLEYAAAHILATMVYNDVKQGGLSFIAALNEATDKIRAEYQLMKDNESEMELKGPRGKSENVESNTKSR